MAVTISGDGSVTGINIEATDIADGTITAAKLSNDIEFGVTTIGNDDTATYSDGDFFYSSSGFVYRLLNDGTSSSWYSLGDGTKQTIPALNSVDTLAGGNASVSYINKKGELYVIGYNAYGQLGLGHNNNVQEWTKVTGNVKKVFASGGSTFIIRQDGSVWATGSNNSGQLGLGDTVDRNEFVKINITNVEKVSPNSHTLILKTDGSVWAAGANTQGQFGLGDTTNRSSFTQIVSSGVTDIAAGGSTSYYINSSGAVYSCGYNYYGQLGRGNTTTYNTFGATNITSNASKLFKGGSSHAAVIGTSGQLWTVGQGIYGQNGNGSYNAAGNRSSWTQVVSSGVVEVVVSGSITMYMNSSGAVYGAGSGNSGQLGVSTAYDRYANFTASTITSGGVSLAAYGSSSYVLLDDDTIESTGNNSFYQLGDGTTTQRTSFGSANVPDAVGSDQAASNKTVGQLA